MFIASSIGRGCYAQTQSLPEETEVLNLEGMEYVRITTDVGCAHKKKAKQ